ncbi:glycoside hydrolase family 127 protein [Paenibacillus hexagrammi]|uniref:Glycoside hydrolase family 127 protein n=1 Tax=Paenibacillus hexagrammi TaxID=2908839 RepID=A0ABY3SQE3_9BACL|nr:beta-L-arabinofuranosidase domain-containing protein [Paenibacillus sp. YPD9-1]UJF35469.1 glycoside hydrolase family 127 protein [Paenibacillus sp. YPD9-1]
MQLSVRIHDSFWSEYIRLVKEVVVPYQWEALHDRVPGSEPSYAVRNFKIAAGLDHGEHGGMVFQDSDPAKWLEAVGYLLQTHTDPDLEAMADELISYMVKAQQADGYLNTYFTIKEQGKRWTNLAECHELYCAGHFIEGAVAYYRATGKRMILDAACKLADHINTVFGPEDGQIQGYDGHQEIELALVKLYRETGEAKYLELSRFFLEQRGQQPHFYLEEFEKRGGSVHFPQLDIAHDFAYSQAHLPVRNQETAEGHAVRVVYMCTGMADVAAETGDEDLLQACRKLWRNIVSKRMYLTGAIGSQEYGESFTYDYDLPSDTAYAETCASIGLIFFAQRMLQIEPKSEYANVMERALYNTVVSGMSRDGKRFFYVNPLEVDPARCRHNKNYAHVKAERQGWFGCACCPPNIARLIASLGEYIYTQKGETIYTHLYIGGEARFQIGETAITINQQSDYASIGQVHMKIAADHPNGMTFALRIPDWSDTLSVQINESAYTVDSEQFVDGYLRIHRIWKDGDTVDLDFGMPILRIRGHSSIRHTIGKTAIQRGPFVYCLEEADNGEGLHQIVLPAESELTVRSSPDMPADVPVIQAQAYREQLDGNDVPLYRYSRTDRQQLEEVSITFIPYFTWANRSKGEMTVWVREFH